MFAARRSVAWRRASLRYFRPLDRKLVQREPQYGIPMRAELPPRFHAKGIFHGDDLYLREPGCNLGPHSLFSPELTSVEDPFCLLSSSFSPCNRIVAAPVSGNPRWKAALTDLRAMHRSLSRRLFHGG